MCQLSIPPGREGLSNVVAYGQRGMKNMPTTVQIRKIMLTSKQRIGSPLAAWRSAQHEQSLQRRPEFNNMPQSRNPGTGKWEPGKETWKWDGPTWMGSPRGPISVQYSSPSCEFRNYYQLTILFVNWKFNGICFRKFVKDSNNNR